MSRSVSRVLVMRREQRAVGRSNSIRTATTRIHAANLPRIGVVWGEPPGPPEEVWPGREVVLGGGVVSDDDPARECPDCMKRFGDPEHRYQANPSRKPNEWVELIKTMLPTPIQERPGSELWGDKPLAVIVIVNAEKIRIMEAATEWPDPSRPRTRGAPFAEVSLTESAARVAELITAAWGKRISRYRWCPACKSVTEPEHMNAGNVCDGCAPKVLGVVF